MHPIVVQTHTDTKSHLRLYPQAAKAVAGQFPRNHDGLLLFSKQDGIYKKQYTEIEHDVRSLPSHIRLEEDGRAFKTSPRGDYTDKSIATLAVQGRIYETATGGIRIKYPLLRRGRKVIESKLVGDVWADIPDMMHVPKNERTDYPTQKPEALLRRIVEASSEEGSIVADFFCGSGTTSTVAERLGRRWIGCDLGRWGIHVTRKRLLGIENCKPFTLLNLGKYERQHWQGVTFGGGNRSGDAIQAYFEYLTFILKLYGAAPVPGMDFLHGRKGRALVHVGRVDAPVTISDIESALEECARAGQKEVHVLAWEWEMGLQAGTDSAGGSLMHQAARQRGVRLRLLQIPREVMEQQAADKNDVRFFELAYLEAQIVAGAKARERRVRLTDFVVPNPDSLSANVQEKITKWSDWIDYWAVDWDFRHDSFTQGFVAYRTRKERKLDLASDSHVYAAPGRYQVLVKAVDIFGNDTTRAFTIEVE